MMMTGAALAPLASPASRWAWAAMYVAASVALFPTFYIDDTFIHAQYARNLANGAGLVFNPGDPSSYGTSSPLYTLVLALTMFVVPDPLTAMKGIGLLCGALAVAAFHGMVRRGAASAPAPPEILVTAMMLWLANVTLLRWSSSGMETALWLLLQVLSLDYALRAAASGRVSLHAAAGVLAGASILARPEGTIWAMSLVLAAFLAGRLAAIPLRGVCAGAVVFVLAASGPILPWAMYALREFGSVVPNTVLAKGAARPLFDISLIAYARVFVVDAGLAMLPLAVPLVAAALAAIIGPRRAFPWARLAPHAAAGAGFPLLLFLAYWASNGQTSTRYLSILFVPGLWLWTVAAVHITDALRDGAEAARRWRRALRVSQAWAAGSAIAVGAISVPQARVHAASNDRVRDMGRWIAAHTDPGARVAAADIGVLGYESHRTIVDIVGLATREMISRRLTGDVFEYLQEVQPEYLFVRDFYLRSVIPSEAAGILTPVAELRFDTFSLLDRSGDRFVLYKLNWSAAPFPARLK